ncbi:hypothetical protein BDW69DRAFT_174181 [Aspergillus filifer]
MKGKVRVSSVLYASYPMLIPEGWTAFVFIVLALCNTDAVPQADPRQIPSPAYHLGLPRSCA